MARYSFFKLPTLSLVAILILVSVSGCEVFESFNCNICATQSVELQQRGKQLRAEIETKYKTYESLSSPNNKDIQDIVAKYITAGMSFEDAKAILRSAGFDCEVSDEPINPRHIPETITPSYVGIFKFPSPWYFSATIEIRLFPEVTGDFHSKIKTVYAFHAYASL